MKTYRMCTLAQGNQRSSGWIEDRGAIMGAMVEIEELGGFWEVTGVGSKELTREEMHEQESRARKPFTAMKSYRGNK